MFSRISLFILFVTLIGTGCVKEENKIPDQEPVVVAYYYGFDEKIPLTTKKNTLLVKFTDDFNQENTEQSLKDIFPGIKIIWRKSNVAEIVASSENQKNFLAWTLKLRDDVYTCQPFYTLLDGCECGVTDEILIKFLPEVDEEKRTELLNTNSVVIIKTTKIYQKLRIPKGADALSIANQIYESGLVKFCYPNFIVTANLL
jgi:hypothetical protein